MVHWSDGVGSRRGRQVISGWRSSAFTTLFPPSLRPLHELSSAFSYDWPGRLARRAHGHSRPSCPPLLCGLIMRSRRMKVDGEGGALLFLGPFFYLEIHSQHRMVPSKQVPPT